MSTRADLKYLQDELSGEEDASLTIEETYSQRQGKYKVPPKIRTLSEWGQQVIPSGKQAGKTFEKVFMEDDGYLMQIKNRKASSAWMLNFQNYLKAMWDHRHRHQLPEPVTRSSQPKDKTQPIAVAMASASKIRSTSTVEEGGEKVGVNKTGQKNKRENSEVKEGTSTRMTMEPNQERVEKIQMQIAILQRELARETQVPEDQ